MPRASPRSPNDRYQCPVTRTLGRTVRTLAVHHQQHSDSSDLEWLRLVHHSGISLDHCMGSRPSYPDLNQENWWVCEDAGIAHLVIEQGSWEGTAVWRVTVVLQISHMSTASFPLVTLLSRISGALFRLQLASWPWLLQLFADLEHIDENYFEDLHWWVHCPLVSKLPRVEVNEAQRS